LNYKLIIPARKNSKRFPGKNLVKLGNLYLLEHTIKYAIKNVRKEDIWVNSDDDEILEIAQSYSIQTYKRCQSLATDLTSTQSVIKDQLLFFKKEDIDVDSIILLQVTNPLRPPNLLIESIKIFQESGRSSLAGFSKLNKKHGLIQKERFIPTNYIPGQRMQDLTPEFFENGLIYITKKDSILKGEIITRDVYPMVIDHIFSTVDVDEPEDLEWAQFLINRNEIIR